MYHEFLLFIEFVLLQLCTWVPASQRVLSPASVRVGAVRVKAWVVRMRILIDAACGRSRMNRNDGVLLHSLSSCGCARGS